MNKKEWFRPILYLVVILVSPVLDNNWLVSLQAAVGGLALGAYIERHYFNSNATN